MNPCSHFGESVPTPCPCDSCQCKSPGGTCEVKKKVVINDKYMKGPFKADFMGGYVFSGSENFMFAQVRGWGTLQYGPNAKETQDAHLQFLVDALNEKADRENRCTTIWRAGVLSPPGEPKIPDGTRCCKPPHKDNVPHEFRTDGK